MRLFVGVVGRSSGYDIAALDADGAEIFSTTTDLTGLLPLLRGGLPGRPVVVGFAPEIDAAAITAELGWTISATNRGHVDWPAGLIVEPHGRGASYAARLAWRWHHDPGALTVVGDRNESYVVVATADLAEELVVEIDPAAREAVTAAIAALPGVRSVTRVTGITSITRTPE